MPADKPSWNLDKHRLCRLERHGLTGKILHTFTGSNNEKPVYGTLLAIVTVTGPDGCVSSGDIASGENRSGNIHPAAGTGHGIRTRLGGIPRQDRLDRHRWHPN
jgi:hypothetical protein